MKAPGEQLRQLLAAEIVHMLHRVQINWSRGLGGPIDMEALALIQTHPDRFDFAVPLTNHVLEELGFTCGEPVDPRFDKTRRAAAKAAPKPPKGMSKAELEKWEAEHGAAAP